MKRLIITLLLTIGALMTCAAQPRAMGIRIGAGGPEASYQHHTLKNQFIECSLGMDAGYNVNGNPGIKATAVYNFIWAQPAWTAKGTWTLYAGPGLSLGYVDDIVPYETAIGVKGYNDYGTMIGADIQVGLEYEFHFPLQIALDFRPCFGIHINDGEVLEPGTKETIRLGRKTGFYDNGLLGLIPSLNLRYCF